MNDLSNTITEGITVQYADDTTFITDSWFTENCLIVNDSIIQMIPISTPQKIAHLPNINVTIKNTKIATCDSVKLLGILEYSSILICVLANRSHK